MGWLLLRAFIAAAVVVAVTEVANRSPRLGALLLTLPVVSIVAFVATWTRDSDLPAISQLARETLILIPLGLPLTGWDFPSGRRLQQGWCSRPRRSGSGSG